MPTAMIDKYTSLIWCLAALHPDGHCCQLHNITTKKHVLCLLQFAIRPPDLRTYMRFTPLSSCM